MSPHNLILWHVRCGPVTLIDLIDRTGIKPWCVGKILEDLRNERLIIRLRGSLPTQWDVTDAGKVACPAAVLPEFACETEPEPEPPRGVLARMRRGIGL